MAAPTTAKTFTDQALSAEVANAQAEAAGANSAAAAANAAADAANAAADAANAAGTTAAADSLAVLEGGTHSTRGPIAPGDSVEGLAATVLAQVDTADRVVASSKNMFNPTTDVEAGFKYLDGGSKMFDANYRATVRYPLAAGEPVSASGLGTIKGLPFARRMHFWDGAGTFIKSVPYPDNTAPTDYVTEVAPAGTASVSFNLPDLPNALPERLQIEVAAAPTAYESGRQLSVGLVAADLGVRLVERSAKNLYDGRVQQGQYINNLGGVYSPSTPGRAVSSFVPVQDGQTYTISGLDPALVPTGSNRRVAGYSADRSYAAGFVKVFPAWATDTYTVTVDDPAVRFLVVQLAYDDALADPAAALAGLTVQVEGGGTATTYEPYEYPLGTADLRAQIRDLEGAGGGPATATGRVNEFVEVGAVGVGMPIVERAPTKGLGPFGVSYTVAAEPADGAAGSNLYALAAAVEPGARALYADLTPLDAAGAGVAVPLAARPFTVPSGMLDNPNPPPEHPAAYPVANYVHPSIAYDAAGVAGYKYWMVASAYPPFSTGGAQWEDEDVFVSNDAVTWLRVRSLYETDKAYTTPSLRLPPNDFAADARRHGFLPVPASGDALEMSYPSDNGGPSADRATKTLTGLPFKHDPFVMVDGGYVYVYHSFHLPHGGSSNGAHRFLVLTRTSDGVNWESVRSDGSTLALDSVAAVRTLFTKDGSGRYNYLHYAYSRSNSNPEVVRYGPNDYELVYGFNFGKRYKGTAPWAFDFTTEHPFQDVSSGNHPGLLYDGSTLYLLANHGAWSSTDRGATMTPAAHYPSWVGGASNIPYKRALCVGEGGKVVTVMSKRVDALAYKTASEAAAATRTNQVHETWFMEYPSVAAYAAAAASGLVGGYADVQVVQVNEGAGTRTTRLFPLVGPATAATNFNNVVQRVKVCDLDVEAGDVIHLFVSLTARTGGAVRFGGLEFV